MFTKIKDELCGSFQTNFNKLEGDIMQIKESQ